MPRLKREPSWVVPFLAAYRNSGNMRASCQAAGVARSTVWQWRQRAPEHESRFLEAQEDATEVLEAEARRRAMSTSDVLIIFLLKSLRPEVYRDRYEVRHTAAIRAEAERCAAETGLNVDDLIAEAERVLAGA